MIFPVFRYRDAHAAIDWLQRAFGFEKHVEYTSPDGSVGHAELKFGGGGIGVNSATPPVADNPWTTVRQGLYVALEDVDTHFHRACNAGARIARPVTDTDYGSREYSAWDPGNHLWSFGSYQMAAGNGASTMFAEYRYDDAHTVQEWLARAFGFDPALSVPGPDGTLLHAEMRLAGGVFMLGSKLEDPQWRDHTEHVNVYVADPDAHFARAKAAGATIVQPPTDTPYGARGYAARDPEEFLWNFSTFQPSST